MRSGRFDGVSYDADRAVLMRAVLEGLARRSATIVEQLEGAVGASYELVLAAGHPTRVRLWRELRMAAYARPMAAVTEPETTAFGAALLAAHALVGADAQRLAAGRERWD